MVDKEDKLLGYLLKQIETNPDLVDSKIANSEGEQFISRSPFIKIQRYARNFLEDKTDQRIIILPGLRGVGKTTLLFQIFNWLLRSEKFPKERLLYFSLDYVRDNMGSNIGEIIDVYEKNILKEPIEKLKDPLFLFIDEAYSSKMMLRIIQSLHSIPYIPFQKRIKEPTKDSPKIWNKMFLYFRENKEEFMEHYHKRSNVETTFAMIKTRLGEFLHYKNYDAQRNELLMKFICHNICCLIQEIYERDAHINFKGCLQIFVERKVPEGERKDFPLNTNI